MRRDAAGAALAARVRAWVDGSLAGAPPEPFDALALDLFAYQRARDPVVAALVEAEPADAAGIPAVPVALFKQVAVGTVREGGVAFRTSGTTVGARGVHRMAATDLYDHNALAWARRRLGPLPGPIVALLEDPATAPDSSLSHMVAALRALAGPGRTTWHLREGELDLPGLTARVAALDGPAFVAATAFALAEWLDAGAGPLPPGSIAMVTGGFKGRTTHLDEATLFGLAAERLRARVVTEYGMTELSSQLWGEPGGPYHPPPWLRVSAVDPVSGAARPAGEAGQLRFLDLCNLDGALHVETLDEGVVHPDGAVSLRGRLPGASLRGCSLPVEEAWRRR